MTYQEWAEHVPDEIKADAVWRIEGYRLALFAADIGWQDVTALYRDPRTRSLADQLCRALGSISANIEEGYSRGTGRDRARFWEYALGSARESRGWYYKARHVLGADASLQRMKLITSVIRLLLTMVPQQRASALREEGVSYDAEPTGVGTANATDHAKPEL